MRGGRKTNLGDDDIESIRQCVSALQVRGDKDYDNMLWLAALAKLRRDKELEAVYNAHEDKPAIQAQIDEAIEIAIGRQFTFTGHGIARNLGSLFREEDLHVIFNGIAELCHGLRQALGVQAFVTSGTLLGLIRDGRVIPHDDDFDLAYVSMYSDPQDILEERFEIFRFLQNTEQFAAKKNGGHLGLSFRKGGLSAYVDLFTGWIADGFYNEDPLDPNAIRANDVTPIKKMHFYGVDIPVPRTPTALLEVNYGRGWRRPDPSFRFDFNKNGTFYSFLNSKEDDKRYEP